MAHFAEVKDGVVLNVIVVSNDDCGGGTFPESEPIGQAFLLSLGFDGEWLQCSYHGNFRGIMAGIGLVYNSELDEFTQPQPVEP